MAVHFLKTRSFEVCRDNRGFQRGDTVVCEGSARLIRIFYYPVAG